MFQAPKSNKRQRKNVNRFGQTEKDVSKDEYFFESENDGASTGSSTDDEGSIVEMESKSKMPKIRDDIHTNKQLKTQIAKIEAKNSTLSAAHRVAALNELFIFTGNKLLNRKYEYGC